MKYMTKLVREISEMDIEKAIQILKTHNEWRRCINIPSEEMVNPVLLGQAIDLVVEKFGLPNIKNEREVLISFSNWWNHREACFVDISTSKIDEYLGNK